MSFGGNNDGSGQGPQRGGQRPYPQSYNDPAFGQPVPPSNNRTLYWILGIVSAVTIGGALTCCGGGYFLVQFATAQLATQFRAPVQNSPEVIEHIGDIEDMTLSFRAMQAAGDQGKLVFEVKGSKGSGKVVVDMAKVEDDPDNAFELVLSDGTRVPITEVDLGRLKLDEPQMEEDPVGETPETGNSAAPTELEPATQS